MADSLMRVSCVAYEIKKERHETQRGVILKFYLPGMEELRLYMPLDACQLFMFEFQAATLDANIGEMFEDGASAEDITAATALRARTQLMIDRLTREMSDELRSLVASFEKPQDPSKVQ